MMNQIKLYAARSVTTVRRGQVVQGDPFPRRSFEHQLLRYACP